MTNMKKKMKKTYRKNTKWMAAAVLSAALLSGQVMPVAVAGSSSVVEISTIFPENITIESPVPLSEISLPNSEYGKLSWADDSQVPSKRSEAFEVVFRPFESFDLSRIDGWDGESEKITGYVTVVVSSIVQPSEEENYAGYEGDAEFLPEDGASESGQDGNDYEESLSPTDMPVQSDISENQDGEQQEEANDSSAPKEGETVQPNESDDKSGQSGNDQNNDADNGQNITEEAQDSPDADLEEEGEKLSDAESAGPDGEQPEDTDSTKDTDAKDQPDEALDEEPVKAEDGDEDAPETTEAPDDAENPDDGENSDDSNAENPDGDNTENPDDSEIPDNIFDRDDEIAEDNRPVTAEEDLTEEEMQQRAEENHSCDGIYVSGINLPWYVQFRATSGESYEFSNESEASIFRSYEFELWDLKNDTEYEIPDGEYISVTIPVKAGYEYTIEHLLENGATETIIPSVEGSTMVFSTHSFSPFGIAGSKPLVGGDLIDNTYLTPTPTAAPTKAPAGTTPNTNTNPNPGSGTTPGSSNGDDGNVSGGNGNSSVSPSSGTDSNSSGSGSSGSGDTNNGSQSSTKDSAVRNSTTSKAVKTGDNTQILPFVILVAAAVVIIAAVLILKRKKK